MGLLDSECFLQALSGPAHYSFSSCLEDTCRKGDSAGKEDQSRIFGSVTVTSQLLGLPLTVSFSLSSLCLFPSWSFCCLLALLLCPPPVFWPCFGPSTLGGVRPCAHGMSNQASLLASCYTLLPASVPHSSSPPAPTHPCFSGTPSPSSKAPPVPLSSAHPFLAGPARASGPHSSDSPP